MPTKSLHALDVRMKAYGTRITDSSKKWTTTEGLHQPGIRHQWSLANLILHVHCRHSLTVHRRPCRAYSIPRSVAKSILRVPIAPMRSTLPFMTIPSTATQHFLAHCPSIRLFIIYNFDTACTEKLVSSIQSGIPVSHRCFTFLGGVLLSWSAHRWRQRDYGRHDFIRIAWAAYVFVRMLYLYCFEIPAGWQAFCLSGSHRHFSPANVIGRTDGLGVGLLPLMLLPRRVLLWVQ